MNALSNYSGTPSNAAYRLFVLAVLTIAVSARSFGQEITVLGGLGFDETIADGDISPSAEDGTDFGPVATSSGFVERTFRIQNIARDDFDPLKGNLVITSISENSSHFEIVSLTSATLGEGRYLDLIIRFDPSSTGSKAATVTILNNDSDEASYTFVLRGQGGIPEIAVYHPDFSGDGLLIFDGEMTTSTSEGTDFGTVAAYGAEVSHTFRVRNTGLGDLTCAASSSSSFFVVTGLNPSIPPGEFDDFSIVFDPQSVGTLTATITITNNDLNENPYTFKVKGVTRAPEIRVEGGVGLNVFIPDGHSTPNTTDRTFFGSRDIGEPPIDRTFRIRNYTNGLFPETDELVVSSIQSSLSEFQILNPPDLPISGGKFADFTIRFDPTSIGNKTATIRITNNDPDDGEGSFTFLVAGTGFAQAEISVYGLPGVADGTAISDGDSSPSGSDGTFFGEVDIETGAVSHTFRIRNDGSETLTVGISNGGSEVFTLSSVPKNVPPGEFDDFDITFDPITIGSSSATITINNNDPDGNEDPYTFSVSGTGKENDSQIDLSIRFPPEDEGGARSGTLSFRGQAGKTYRIITSTDLIGWDIIPELTGITGSGGLIEVDVSGYAPSGDNPVRFFEVIEE